MSKYAIELKVYSRNLGTTYVLSYDGKKPKWFRNEH